MSREFSKLRKEIDELKAAVAHKAQASMELPADITDPVEQVCWAAENNVSPTILPDRTYQLLISLARNPEVDIEVHARYQDWEHSVPSGPYLDALASRMRDGDVVATMNRAVAHSASQVERANRFLAHRQAMRVTTASQKAARAAEERLEAARAAYKERESTFTIIKDGSGRYRR